MSRLPDAGEVARGLAARILSLCAELLPRGRRERDEWCVGSLAGEPGRSLKVHLAGERAGVWCDFASDEKGDALDLVAQVLFAGDKAKAFHWSLSWLGLDGRDPGRLQQTRRAIAEKAVEAANERSAEERSRAACALWMRAAPRILDTPVEAYLKGRGLDIRTLGRQPGALRFHPGLKHPETGRLHPAMVAIIVDAQGAPIACHRTFLEIRRNGAVTKLSGVEDAKLSLGPYRGGMIRLWRGERVDPATGEVRPGIAWRDMKGGEAMSITEGIEDGLTVALADPRRRVGVGISLSNMTSLILPAAIAEVTVVQQNDPPGSKAAQMLPKVFANFQAQGKRVKRALPPAGIKDVADVMQGKAA